MKAGTGKLMISIVILRYACIRLVYPAGAGDPASSWQQLDEAAVSGRYEANFTDDTQGIRCFWIQSLPYRKISSFREKRRLFQQCKRTEIKNPFRLKFVEEDERSRISM
ncbi:MAG: hypothetical protein ACLRXA_22995 [Clostridium sp.]